MSKRSVINSKKSIVSGFLIILILSILLSLVISMPVNALVPGFSDGSDNLNQVSVSLSGSTQITDAFTGITLDIPAGILPAGVTSVILVVQEETVKEISDAAVDKYAAETGTSLKINKVFQLELLDQDGNPIKNFNGKITITVPVTDDSNYVVYFNDAAGTIEVMPSKVGKGFIDFETTHFSYYALVRIEEENKGYIDSKLKPSATETAKYQPQVTGITQQDYGPSPNPPDGAISSVSPAPPKSNPQTGDNILIFLAGLLIVSGTALVFSISSKNIQKEKNRIN